MTMVRAKFRVTDKEPYDQGFVIKMTPVTTGSEENESFYRYTPYGQFEMGTVNERAADYFEVGQEYYLDFKKAGA